MIYLVRRHAFRALACAALAATAIVRSPCAAHADTVLLGAAADASIFQSPAGNGSGAGNVLFAGTNTSGSVRRALISFDVAAGLPAGATVQSVELLAVLGQTAGASPPPSVATDLHRVLNSWGEGPTQQQIPPSDVTAGMGQGASAIAGDVTWTSRFHPGTAWSAAGGDFNAAASGSGAIGATLSQTYSFPSSVQLVSDVQAWLDNPATNFGWLLKAADESTAGTIRGFYSSDVATAALRPQLRVTFEATASPAPADFNGDGTVSGDDLALWGREFGDAPPATADADDDGDADGADFLGWQQQFNAGFTTQSVPEPSAVLLAAQVAACLYCRRCLARRESDGFVII